jgi:dihydroxy-acid dehydratase
MLFTAGVPAQHAMKTFPQVGVASVWWKGNPCNMHLLNLGKEIKTALEKEGMLSWQYTMIRLLDGITMGSDGKSSLRWWILLRCLVCCL